MRLVEERPGLGIAAPRSDECEHDEREGAEQRG
jgi:hypothetical protein